MASKPAKIRQELAARCEAIATARRKKTGEPVIWSQVMAEALALGLTALERRAKRK